MNEKNFALNMPEGTGLLAYLEKGERGPACGGFLSAQGIIQCP